MIVMKGKLKKLKKDDTVGVYRFRDNDFIVGDILKISDNYFLVLGLEFGSFFMVFI